MPPEKKIDAEYTISGLGASAMLFCRKKIGIEQKHFRSPAMRFYQMGEKTNRSDESHADHVSRTCQL